MYVTCACAGFVYPSSIPASRDGLLGQNAGPWAANDLIIIIRTSGGRILNLLQEGRDVDDALHAWVILAC